MEHQANDATQPIQLDPTIDLLAGTVAGMAGLIVGFPFDTVKVRFQSPNIALRYRSTFHAFPTILREEGVFGLYRGISSPMAACALMNGLVFASYRFFTKVQLEHDKDTPTISQIALAGAASGLVSSIITTPTELIKIRQQSMLAPSTARAIALDLYKRKGISGLYRGQTVTALRDCGYGAYFAAYEASCRFFTATWPPSATSDPVSESSAATESPPWPAMLLAGGIAGLAGWLVTFPLDVIKTRVQGSRGGGGASVRPSGTPLSGASAIAAPSSSDPYATALSTAIHSFRSEGMAFFFRGLMPTLIRAFPVNMATFAVFEGVVQIAQSSSLR